MSFFGRSRKPQEHNLIKVIATQKLNVYIEK